MLCFGIINIVIIIILNIIYLIFSSSSDCESCYFVNIKTFLSSFISTRVIIYLMFIIFSFIFGITINYILNNYSPFHLTLPISLIFFIIDIYNAINKMNNITAIIIIIICNIFETILILVFLEIIELNFGGLSQNTKKNINIRCSDEINYISVEDNKERNNSNEEEENNNECESDENN